MKIYFALALQHTGLAWPVWKSTLHCRYSIPV